MTGMNNFDETTIRRGATSPASNSGSFTDKGNSAPETTLGGRDERIERTTTYRGYTIAKVVQGSGRVTYDVRTPDGQPDSWAHEKAAIARAEIDAAIEQTQE